MRPLKTHISQHFFATHNGFRPLHQMFVSLGCSPQCTSLFRSTNRDVHSEPPACSPGTAINLKLVSSMYFICVLMYLVLNEGTGRMHSKSCLKTLQTLDFFYAEREINRKIRLNFMCPGQTEVIFFTYSQQNLMHMT